MRGVCVYMVNTPTIKSATVQLSFSNKTLKKICSSGKKILLIENENQQIGLISSILDEV